MPLASVTNRPRHSPEHQFDKTSLLRERKAITLKNEAVYTITLRCNDLKVGGKGQATSIVFGFGDGIHLPTLLMARDGFGGARIPGINLESGSLCLRGSIPSFRGR